MQLRSGLLRGCALALAIVVAVPDQDQTCADPDATIIVASGSARPRAEQTAAGGAGGGGGGDTVGDAWSHLVWPVTTQTYFASYWEARPLHVSRPDARDYWQVPPSGGGGGGASVGLSVSLESMEVLLEMQASVASDPLLANPETQISQANCDAVLHGMDNMIGNFSVDAAGAAAAAAGAGAGAGEGSGQNDDGDRGSGGGRGGGGGLYQAYLNGATLVCNLVPAFWPPLATYTKAISDATGYEHMANLYLTPPGGQGFTDHTDNTDGIVAQVAGAKRWVVHNSTFLLPNREHRVGRQQQASADSVRVREGGGEQWSSFFNGTIRAGDLLMIPRGWVHHASTAAAAPAQPSSSSSSSSSPPPPPPPAFNGEEPSAHLTISAVKVPTISDFVASVIRNFRPDYLMKRTLKERGRAAAAASGAAFDNDGIIEEEKTSSGADGADGTGAGKEGEEGNSAAQFLQHILLQALHHESAKPDNGWFRASLPPLYSNLKSKKGRQSLMKSFLRFLRRLQKFISDHMGVQVQAGHPGSNPEVAEGFQAGFGALLEPSKARARALRAALKAGSETSGYVRQLMELGDSDQQRQRMHAFAARSLRQDTVLKRTASQPRGLTVGVCEGGSTTSSFDADGELLCLYGHHLVVGGADKAAVLTFVRDTAATQAALAFVAALQPSSEARGTFKVRDVPGLDAFGKVCLCRILVDLGVLAQ